MVDILQLDSNRWPLFLVEAGLSALERRGAGALTLLGTEEPVVREIRLEERPQVGAVASTLKVPDLLAARAEQLGRRLLMKPADVVVAAMQLGLRKAPEMEHVFGHAKSREEAVEMAVAALLAPEAA